MRADIVFDNGRFHTLTAEGETTNALAVMNGMIVATGDDASRMEAAERIDLDGQSAVPGFHDAHHHLGGRGAALNAIPLAGEEISSIEALLGAVEAWVRAHPEAEFISGHGYDQFRMGGEHPTAEQLDRVTDGKPCYLMHCSGHMGVANTETFRRAGFANREGVPDVDGGLVVRDSDGRAAGLVQEKAMGLLTKIVKMKPTDRIVDNLATAGDQALREGLTAVTDPGVGAMVGIGSSSAELGAYQTAVDTGRLRIRSTVMPYITTLHDFEDGIAPGRGLDLGIRTGFGDDRLRIGPVKILTDGSLLGRSSAMHECFHGHDTKGFMLWGTEELAELMVAAYQGGFALAMHAIGDRAIDHALDVYADLRERFPDIRRRNRIEHFGVSTLEQVRRTAELGVVPVPQGRFISELGDNMIDALGDERVEGCYRMQSILDAGIVLPGSTDAPVSYGAPLPCIQAMVDRRTSGGQVLAAAEAVSPYEAFRAYSYGSAYAAGIEDRVGVLAPGQLADFTVLSDDPFAIDPSGIGALEVGATVVGGRVEYEAGALG